MMIESGNWHDRRRAMICREARQARDARGTSSVLIRASLSIVLLNACNDKPAPRPVIHRAETDLVRIEGGTFKALQPSCDASTGERVADRGVELESFAIDRMLVTCTAYADCVDAGMCSPLPGDVAHDSPPAPGCDEGLAVVRRADAERYCGFVEGRLPTHLEWQRAVQGVNELRPERGDLGDTEMLKCTRRTSRDPQWPRCVSVSPVGFVHTRWSFVGYEHLRDQACTARSPETGYFRCVYPTE